MRWLKGISLFVFVLLLGGAAFSLFRLLRDPENLYTPLASQIENHLGARLSVEGIRLIFRPLPVLHADQPHLESRTGTFPAVTAEEARFSFRFFPLLLGRVGLSGFQIREGKGTLGEIPFEHIQFKIRRLGSKRGAPFSWRANIAGSQEALQGKGELSLKNPGENFLSDLGLKADVTLKSLSLTEGVGKDLLKDFSEAKLVGQLAGSIHIEKERGAETAQGRAEFQVKDFGAGDSGKLSWEGKSTLLWNLEKGSMELQQFLIQSPFGELEGSGIFRVETREIEEFRFFGRNVVLEEMIRHFPNLQSFLPSGTGFSGASDFDLTLRGTWDYLSLHANLNLTPAVLTYGKFFSKPKDFPMGVNCEFLLKRGSEGGSDLAGDFSVRMRQTTVKGAIANLNLATGDGEITVLTNKFDLKDWETLLPPLSGYQMSGLAKVLVSYKGNVMHPARAETMTNLTLEKATILSPGGRGVEKANVLLDVSPLSFKVKETSFVSGGSSIQMDAEIFNFQENPQGFVRVASPRLTLSPLLENLKEGSRIFGLGLSRVPWEKIEEGAKRFLPASAPLDDFLLNLKTAQNKWILESLAFRVLEGSFNLRGEMDRSSEKPTFWLEGEIERLNLARYGETAGQSEKVWEGNLFLHGRLEGEGLKPEEMAQGLVGRGDLSITNGELHTVDLPEALRGLESFPNFPSRPSASTPFHDLKVRWAYAGEKFDTQELLIHSDDFWIEGEGNLLLDGTLNSRLDVYLSNPLTHQMLKTWEASREADERQLGPLPFLLIGSLSRPELKPDERRMEDFLEAVRERKFRKILHKPFTERA